MKMRNKLINKKLIQLKIKINKMTKKKIKHKTI